MCILICRFRGNCTDDTPAGLLFQCFAGDNRSSAAWVAWLVFQHHMTASEGIHLLLQARPSLNPWQGRPHILWALKTWEMRRRKLVTSFRPWLTKGCHDWLQTSFGLLLVAPWRWLYPTKFQRGWIIFSDFNILMAPQLRLNHAHRECHGKFGKWLVRAIGRREPKILLWNAVRFQACWWIMAWSWKAFQAFYMDDVQVPPLTNGEPKHGPSYENFCKTHAVRFANWDHRWLASLTADCSAVIDVLVLNRTLATYFQKCIPGPGEKGFLGFRGLHAASFVDMRYAESFYAPITRKIATFLPDARRGIEWWCLQIINGKSWNNVWWLLPFLTWNRSDQTQAWQKDACADYVPWNIFQPTFPWLVLVGLPAYLLALRWLLALKSV